MILSVRPPQQTAAIRGTLRSSAWVLQSLEESFKGLAGYTVLFYISNVVE